MERIHTKTVEWCALFLYILLAVSVSPFVGFVVVILLFDDSVHFISTYGHIYAIYYILQLFSASSILALFIFSLRHTRSLSIPLLVSLGKFYACFQHKIGYSFCEQTRSAVVLLLLLFFPLLFSCSLALRYSHMNVKSNIFYKASNPSTCTYILLIMQEFLISGGQTTKKIEQNERKRTT